MHYKSMFESKFLASWDLPEGRDAIATIDRCVAGEITGQNGRSEKKPLLYLSGKDKPVVLNKTNGKTIASLYGTDTRNWKGKKIALYVGETSSPDGVVPCIRIRPTIPSAPARALPEPESAQAEESEDAPI